MKQAYHPNTKTNVHTRQFIRQSNLTHEQFADQYAISKDTVSKWSNRVSCEDKSSKPHKTHDALSEQQTAIAIELRKTTWGTLDKIAEAMSPEQPQAIRSL